MVVVVVPSLISPTLPYAQYGNMRFFSSKCSSKNCYMHEDEIIPAERSSCSSLLMPVVGDSLRESSQTHELNII
jgi:hypothetical protein